MSKMMPLARRFVAGVTLDEAVPRVQALNALGIQTTVTELGEDVSDRREATRAAHAFIQCLDRIQERALDANVSLKLTQMGLDIDESFCFDNAMQVVEKAAQTHNFVRIDMEGPRHTQAVLDLFRRLHREQPRHVGVVVQSMLHRTEQDVSDLLAAGVRLRLCKGAYKFPAGTAYRKKKDVARSYQALAGRLLDSDIYHGLATHDEALIRWVQQHVEERRLDRDTFEFQMLYGMRRNRQIQLAEAGYRIRCYVPYGAHWFPYFSRRLRERKENVFFVLRNLFTHD